LFASSFQFLSNTGTIPSETAGTLYTAGATIAVSSTTTIKAIAYATI
jgi:hypothetical protein